MSNKGFGKLVAGVGIGLGLGLLLAPKTGKETREDLKKGALNLKDKVCEIDLNEVRADLVKQYEKLAKEIKTMDSEKAKAIATKKINELSLKANDLYEEAKEKAEPYVEKGAKELKRNLSDLLEEVQKKLED